MPRLKPTIPQPPATPPAVAPNMEDAPATWTWRHTTEAGWHMHTLAATEEEQLTRYIDALRREIAGCDRGLEHVGDPTLGGWPATAENIARKRAEFESEKQGAQSELARSMRRLAELQEETTLGASGETMLRRRGRRA